MKNSVIGRTFKRIGYSAAILSLLILPLGQGFNRVFAATDLTGTGTFSQAFGIAVDSSGNVFVTNQGNSTSNAIEELPNGGSSWTDLTGTGGAFSKPSGVAVDSSGNVFVTNQGNSTSNAIEELPNGRSSWTDLTGTGGAFSNPSGIAVDSAGDLFVTNAGSNKIVELAHGSSTWTDITGSGSFDQPTGIAVDSAGDVFVTNYGNGTIEELPSGGLWTNITGTGLFTNPSGIAVDSTGNLFVADFGSSKIMERPIGFAWQDVTGSNTFVSPSGVAVDTAGNLYVTNTAAMGGFGPGGGVVVKYTPLLAPTGLTASNTTSTGTTLTWDAVNGATSYNIYEGGTQIASGITSPTNTSPTYTVTGLTQSTTYSFTVSAVNSDGEFSQSGAVTVNTTAVTPSAPTAPTGLAARGTTSTGTTLTWTAASGATSYNVYENNNGTPIATGVTTTSYSLTGLTSGTSYSFTVSAVNSGGESPQSGAVTVNPVNSGSITLTFASATVQSWASQTVTGVVYENGAPLSNAVINLSSTLGYWGVSGTNSSETVTADTYGAFSTTWTAPTVTAATSGTATATVTGAVYGVTPATVSIGVTPPPIVAPSKATGLSASGTTSTGTTLKWTAVSGATSYNVYENNSGTPMKTGITGTTYTVTGLNSDTSYLFKVSAVNSGGESPQSSAVNVTTVAPPIYHPPSLSSNTQIADKQSDSQKYVWSVDNTAGSPTVSVVNGTTATQLTGAIQSTDGSAQTYMVQDPKGTAIGGSTALTNDDVLVVTAADGTTTAQYSISTWMDVKTAAQLEKIDANQEYYLNANIALTSDIDLSGDSNWTPLGTIGAFTGTFDGKNHEVTGVNINEQIRYSDVGFFGHTSGTIEDLGVSATGSVTGGDFSYVGGLVGEQDGGTIRNSFVTGKVNGGNSAQVGGVVGVQRGGTISNSFATATVSGEGLSSDVGGLVGQQDGGTISNSFATGSVSDGGDFGIVGGLVGYSAGAISNAYATGSVTGGDFSYVGGLVGSRDGTIRNSYFAMTTTQQTQGLGSGVTGESTVAMQTQSTYSGWDFTNTWGIDSNVNGGYPYLRAFTPRASEPVSNNTQIADKQSDSQKYVWSVDNTAGSPTVSVVNGTTATQLTGAIQSTDGSAQTYMVQDPKGTAIGGSTALTNDDVLVVTATDGSTTAKYSISTWMDVSTAAQLEKIDANQGYYLNANIALTSDIDLSGDSNWTPLGTIGAFTGTFDGKNHEVTGVTINDQRDLDVGFFGQTSGTIEDLGISATGSVAGGDFSYVGGLVGVQDGGTIRNSFVTGEVNGGSSARVGGLVGWQSLGTTSNNFATATVSGGDSSDVGGLVGYSKDTISNGYATGAVSAGNFGRVGGLVGYSQGTISNGYATGTVSAGVSSYVGGLVGNFSGTITNGYATGSVSGGDSSHVGGLVGLQDGTISNSYFEMTTTKQTQGLGTSSSSGVTGESTAAMQTQSTYSGWDFTNTWGIDSNVNGGYPYLRVMESQKSTASQSFDSSGGTMQQKFGDQTVSVNVPDGAFSTQETVKLSVDSSSNVASLGLPESNVAAVLDVSFSGASPTKPVTVTITNSSIKAGGVVYKPTSDGKLVPLKAMVVEGKATVSFTSDPTFVVLNLKHSERVITTAGHASVVPGLAQAESAHGNKTTYMPIWYVMQLLKPMGIQSTWNGAAWHMTTLGPTILSSLTEGHGKTTIYLNGTVVQKVDTVAATDPSTGRATTYMPIWYVMQLLKRVGLKSTWDGTTWTVAK